MDFITITTGPGSSSDRVGTVLGLCLVCSSCPVLFIGTCGSCGRSGRVRLSCFQKLHCCTNVVVINRPILIEVPHFLICRLM